MLDIANLILNDVNKFPLYLVRVKAIIAVEMPRHFRESGEYSKYKDDDYPITTAKQKGSTICCKWSSLDYPWNWHVEVDYRPLSRKPYQPKS